jgi:hypothetical protein
MDEDKLAQARANMEAQNRRAKDLERADRVEQLRGAIAYLETAIQEVEGGRHNSRICLEACEQAVRSVFRDSAVAAIARGESILAPVDSKRT